MALNVAEVEFEADVAEVDGMNLHVVPADGSFKKD